MSLYHLPLVWLLATLPPSCTAVNVGSTTYWNSGGAFYLPVAEGYKIVGPPLGAIVFELPSSANKIVVNSMTYFSYGGGYYRPFYSGSTVIYQIVKDPTNEVRTLQNNPKMENIRLILI